MHREKTFFQRNYAIIVLLVTILPSFLMVGLAGTLNLANTKCYITTVAIASFSLVLMSAMNIFNAVNFFNKRTLVSFIMLSVIVLLMILPTVYYITNIPYETEGNVVMGNEKRVAIVLLASNQIFVIMAVFMSAFRIDLNKKHRELE